MRASDGLKYKGHLEMLKRSLIASALMLCLVGLAVRLSR